MTNDQMQRVEDKFQLKFWHMAVTLVLLPLITLMGGSMGSMVLYQQSIMTAKIDLATQVALQNKQDLAVNKALFDDHDRRISSVEVRTSDLERSFRRSQP